jgi:three-Cys-motif partner protein
MAQETSHVFGGGWTEQKLNVLSQYLVGFNHVIKKSGLRRWYVDAYAGTGKRLDPTTRAISDGSAKLALDCEPPFDRLYFVESNKTHFNSLSALISSEQRYSSRADVRRGDANTLLAEFCAQMPRDARAVVFLDPYAMQVTWKTMESIAATKKCDVWILMPVMAINRLLTRSGTRPDSWNEKLNAMLGTDDWRTAFYAPSRQDDLFAEEPIMLKDASAETIAKYYHDRLGQLFEGGTADRWKTMKNSKNSALFALMFAMGNPSPKARGPALNIANHLLNGI